MANNRSEYGVDPQEADKNRLEKRRGELESMIEDTTNEIERLQVQDTGEEHALDQTRETLGSLEEELRDVKDQLEQL